ncbi:MAG: TIGR04282 family arsenosugar biosynthesis glycosyltransferase [Cyclobacteriaceae bacterium]|nr:TIGR04282 family arsenosugar biosynthesis glycosyltransferase [Cyclobacteriaceae bacterium]
MNNILIVFARKPELGKVKTRLAKSVGDKKALHIYSMLLTKTLKTAKKSIGLLKTYWSSSNGVNTQFLQRGNDLGERMFNALKDQINPSTKVCLIGADSPQLTPEIIKKAYQLLETNDIIYGPSLDGGYYLVAIKGVVPKELFINKKWSHSKVLEEALETCEALHLKVELLPQLADIDTVEDYNGWLKSIE